MRFGLNFFPSFRPQDSTTADYYQQCLRIAERADVLGYSSIKTVEHSFYDYGGDIPPPRRFSSGRARRPPRAAPPPAPRSSAGQQTRRPPPHPAQAPSVRPAP